MSVIEMKHRIWDEKYRPRTLETYVADPALKEKMQRCIDNQHIGNLLLYGKPGVGKTTLAKILVDNIECEHIYINGSKDNGVDFIRNTVQDFAQTHGFYDLKIVIIDEFDYFSIPGQASLRVLMEQYSNRVSFILSCNYIEKVLEPIRDRAENYMMEPPSKKMVAEFMISILEKENIEYNIEDIGLIVNKCFPSIRKCVKSLQQNSVDGKLQLVQKNLIEQNYMNDILNVLKSSETKPNKLKQIRKIIADSKLNNFVDLYSYLFENIDEYGIGHIGEIILLIDDGQYKDSFVVDKQLHIIRVLAEIIMVI